MQARMYTLYEVNQTQKVKQEFQNLEQGCYLMTTKNICIQIHKNVGSLVSRASRQYEDSKSVIF